MKAPHLFALGCMLKWLNPSIIVESGVFKGQGTWMIHSTLPTAKIFSIDPNQSQIMWKTDSSKYLNRDITDHTWVNCHTDDVLILFDDHQNAVERLRWCKDQGFQHLIFEDNYRPGVGDCYSLKQAFAGQDRSFLDEVLEEYWEFPPVSSMPLDRWGEPWNSPEPLFPHHPSKVWELECQSYTWICYAKVKS